MNRKYTGIQCTMCGSNLLENEICGCIGKGVMKFEEKNPTDKQIGGNHYKNFAIQPIEFIQKNKLGFCEGNIIKYACRWRCKNGLEDLKKIKHYVDLLIELEGLE